MASRAIFTAFLETLKSRNREIKTTHNTCRACHVDILLFLEITTFRDRPFNFSKFPASARRRKKIACSTNGIKTFLHSCKNEKTLQSRNISCKALWRGKNPTHQVSRKKILPDQKITPSPPPPPQKKRVKWLALYKAMFITHLLSSKLPSSAYSLMLSCRPLDNPCSVNHTCCSKIVEYTPLGQQGTHFHDEVLLCQGVVWDSRNQCTESDLFLLYDLLLDLCKFNQNLSLMSCLSERWLVTSNFRSALKFLRWTFSAGDNL